MTGTIEIYFKNRGYGFIKHVDENRIRTTYFFHIMDVRQGDPIPDSKCEFDLGPERKSGKTPPAINVRVSEAQ